MPDMLDMIWEVKQQGFLFRGGKTELSTSRCLDILKDEGYQWASEISASGVNRALAENGYRDGKMFKLMKPDRACQVMLYDASRSECFQTIRPVGGDSDDWVVRVTSKFERDQDAKAGRIGKRLWVACIMDMLTRIPLLMYTPAAGETVAMGIQMLDRLFNRPDDALLLRHRPELIQADQGVFLKSRITQDLLQHIGTEWHMSSPGAKESGGMIERNFRSLWQTFELDLATRIARKHGEGSYILLSEVQRLAHQWCIERQGKRNTFHLDMTNAEVYMQSIREHPQPLIDVEMSSVAFSNWERSIDSKTGIIRLNNFRLQIPNHATWALGKLARVYRTLNGGWVCEVINDNRGGILELKPFEYEAYGEFEKTAPLPVVDSIKDRVKKAQKVMAIDRRQERKKIGSPTTPTVTHASDTGDRVSLLEARGELGRILRSEDVFESESQIIDLLDHCQQAGNLHNEMTTIEIRALAERLVQLGSDETLRLAV
jgi:transposase InsO family protein